MIDNIRRASSIQALLSYADKELKLSLIDTTDVMANIVAIVIGNLADNSEDVGKYLSEYMATIMQVATNTFDTKISENSKPNDLH